MSSRKVPLVCAGCGIEFLGRPTRPGAGTKRYHSRECFARSGDYPPPVRRGAENNRYNGGLCFSEGRWLITCRDGTTMLYSRGVMASYVGRLLEAGEIVHHINENTSDDNLENLQLTDRAGHMALHREALAAAARPHLPRGERHHRSKLSDAEVEEIRTLRRDGWSSYALGTRFGVSAGHVMHLVKGRARVSEEVT